MNMSFATHFSLTGSGFDLHTLQAAIPGQQVYCSIRSPRCCENGQLIVTNHASGQTVCTCQMKNSTQTYAQRAPMLPETFFNAANSHIHATASFLGEESSTFYHSMTNLPTDSLKSASAGASFYYDNLLVAHPYGSFYPGLDLNNSARRKNATRATTSPLKAWLYEHRKNPYPTKGEKIMLAIVTRMTLTQVSTWFANARRRLKKEKRMGFNLKDGDDDSDCDLSTEKADNQADRDTGERTSYQCSTSDENDSLNVSDISDPEDQSDLKNKPTIEEHLLGLPLCASGHENNLKQNDNIYISGQTVRRDDSISFKTTSHSERITSIYTPKEVETPNLTRHPKCVSSENGNCKTKIWSISDIIGSSDNLNSTSTVIDTCLSSHKSPVCIDSNLTLVRVDPSPYSSASTNKHTNDNSEYKKV